MKVMYKKKEYEKGVEAELHGGKLGAKWKRHPTKFPVEGIGRIRRGVIGMPSTEV